MQILRDSVSLGYIGQRRSSVVAHYLLGNGYRMYNVVIKHFLSWDSVSPFDVGGTNGYGYCQFNPTNQSDKSGKGPLLDLMALIGESFIGNVISLGTDTEVAVTAESIVQAQLLGTDDAFLSSVMANPELSLISEGSGAGFRVAISGQDILLDPNEIMRTQGGNIFSRLWDIDLEQISSVNIRSGRLTNRNGERFSCGLTDSFDGEVLDLFRTVPGRRRESLSQNHLLETEHSFFEDVWADRIHNYAPNAAPPAYEYPPSYADSLGLPPTYTESQEAERLRRRRP